MTAISITPGYPTFADTDGSPLNDGYVYIGLEYQDPITAPTGAFWDKEFRIPADQPLRTSGGYVVRNGSPAAVYTGAAYSILVQNKNLVTVYNAPSAVITNVTNDVEEITQYQGAHATDPIARNDGTPLQVGDLYFNSVVNELKVWSGSAWVPSSPGSVTVQDFTGTGSQTSFNLATAPVAENNTQIYIDGLYQQKDTYSVSGAAVNFSTAPPLNSKIEVVNFTIASLGTVDASNVSYNEGSPGAVNTSVQAKLQETVSIKDFGAVGDGVTDDTVAVQTAISYCLTNKKSLYIPVGNFVFTALEFNAADYPISTYGERGIRIVGESRTDSRLNGSLTFSAITPYVDYNSRFTGMIFDNVCLYNGSGNALTFSGFGKTALYNCLVRADTGIGLSLLGGSEFAGYNTEIFGSYTNLKVRDTTASGDVVDSAVITFNDCNIANTVGGVTPLNIDYVGTGRSITFVGGNIISSQSKSYFENGQVNFIAVDFENTNPVECKDSKVTATACLFAQPTPRKVELTNSSFLDISNLWDASVQENIVLKDADSKVFINGHYGSFPTVRIELPATVPATATPFTTGQITFKRARNTFVNFDFSKDIIQPYDVNLPVVIDTSTSITGGASIYANSANTYIVLPLDTSAGPVNLREISAIEWVATTSQLKLVVGGLVVDANTKGLVYNAQIFLDVSGNPTGFSRYIFIPTADDDITEIRYVFAATGPSGTRFDSSYIYGNVVDGTLERPSAPTTGPWSVGDRIYNSVPSASGNIGWVCVTAGTPGTWKSYGTISA